MVLLLLPPAESTVTRATGSPSEAGTRYICTSYVAAFRMVGV
jgi:hypothetical protein